MTKLTITFPLPFTLTKETTIPTNDNISNIQQYGDGFSCQVDNIDIAIEEIEDYISTLNEYDMFAIFNGKPNYKTLENQIY